MKYGKLDKNWVGLLMGLAFPWVAFSIYWLIFQREVKLAEDDVRYLINKEVMTNVFKMCCGVDLILFYIGLNKQMTNFTKGIIGGVLVYALVLAYLTFV